MTDPRTFAARRTRVLDALTPDGAMVLAAAPEVMVGRDLEMRYVADADFWYLTGCPEPGAVAVLRPGGEAPFTLFVRPRDPERETWTGPRVGVEGAGERWVADAAFGLDELERRLPDLVGDAERVLFRVGGGRPEVERAVLDVVARGRGRRLRTGLGPATLADPGLILDDMRLIKEPAEVAAIREAVAVSVAAFRAGFEAARPGAGEWAVEAAVEGAMRRAGAEGPAFATIAASAGNAAVLHYIANDRVMDAGDLLLLDAGARVARYNADLTRTVPVGGHFSEPQRDLYAAVLAARDAAFRAVRAGATTRDVHNAALAVLLRAMVDLGLLDGDPAELLEQTDRYKPWYPHNTSHWLGLDVHDVGSYAIAGEPRRLEPGMVLTIEPGLYVPGHAEDAPKHLRGLGVRIEDDLLVTPDGHEVLSADLPASINEVEALLG